MTDQDEIIVRTAVEADSKYSQEIVDEMASSAKARGTGIAKRSPEYVSNKMKEGKGIIALTKTGLWVGFCYIESWGHEKFVANSGLIVNPAFRGRGVAKAIKFKAFDLSRKKIPHRQNLRTYNRSASYENQQRTRLPSRAVFGTHRRRRVLERMPKLRKLRNPHFQKPQKLPLHWYALRPRMGKRNRSQGYEQVGRTR